MHMAAAVGTPVVCLFGPTNADSWHPWSDQQMTLQKACPCQKSGERECDWSVVRACLQNIQPAEVKAALEPMLKTIRTAPMSSKMV